MGTVMSIWCVLFEKGGDGEGVVRDVEGRNPRDHGTEGIRHGVSELYRCFEESEAVN
jgi:hypothetical protein